MATNDREVRHAADVQRRHLEAYKRWLTEQPAAHVGHSIATDDLPVPLSLLRAAPARDPRGAERHRDWNGANEFISYGKGGELATNRLDEQVLVWSHCTCCKISLVYVNTLMIQQVLHEPNWKDGLGREDLRALTPLVYGHVNPHGKFRLDLEERLAIDGNWQPEYEYTRSSGTRPQGGPREHSAADAVPRASFSEPDREATSPGPATNGE